MEKHIDGIVEKIEPSIYEEGKVVIFIKPFGSYMVGDLNIISMYQVIEKSTTLKKGISLKLKINIVDKSNTDKNPYASYT